MIENKTKEELEQIEKDLIKILKDKCFGFDTESNHCDADDVMVMLAEKLGMDELAEKYNEVDKWFA